MLYKRKRRNEKKSKTNLNVKIKRGSGKTNSSFDVQKIKDVYSSPLMDFIPSRGPKVTFLGKFKFGSKEDMINLSKLLKVGCTTSPTPKTAAIVVDDLTRTDSITLDKARKKGVLIITEEEFLSIVSNGLTTY